MLKYLNWILNILFIKKSENNLGRAAGSNLIMKDNILTDNGLQHLQELIRSGAIHAQCTEMDITFIRQFVDIYMQKDEFGLAKLQCLIQEQSKENAENSSPKSNEDRLLNQNFLLSFYICLLTRIIQSSGPVILQDRPQICEFIRQFHCQLFNRHSTQFSSNLCQLSYDFLLELHKMQFPIKYWPFQIDLQKLIIFPLEDESTPISLRQSIEKLAIAQLNIAQGPSNENVAANFAGKMELIIPLAEILLAADFSLVFESCSRIFCSCENIGQLLYTLPEERLYQRIIQKAKSRTQRIGNSFAELVAKLISFQFQNDHFHFDTVANCFQNQFNHSLVLTKIVENMPEIGGKDEEFKRNNKMVLELLATGSNFNLNLIGPLLPKYREIYSEKDFGNFLMNFFKQNNIWRNSYSADGLNAILDALIDIDPEFDGILLETVQSILIPNLLIKQSALIILERISQKIGGEKLLQKRPKLLKPLGDFLKPILIDEIDDYPTNCSNADIIMDSALRILNNFCGQQHRLDPNALFYRLLAISLDREFNESLRQLSLQYLTKYYANKLAGNWAKLFQINIDNDEIKNLILTNAFAQLEESMKMTGNQPDNEFIKCIAKLMNLLEPEEEESPIVLMEASKICEVIVNEIGRFGGAEIEMFASKWAKLKSQVEMIEKRRRDRDRDDLDLRTKMEEMIITLGQNCNIECSEKCGSKDCY